VRARTEADLDACAALMQRTHELDGYPRYAQQDPVRFLASRHETAAWVAEHDGAVVGHLAVHDAARDPTLPAAQRHTGLPPAGLAVVARLLVSPDLRRSGAGGALLDEATRHAHARGQRPVLDVQQQCAAPIALYERRGWRRLEALTLPVEGQEPLLLWVYLGPPPPGQAAASTP
jgi:GNAT superfamily N-acetyltransferase